jgi:hypothetical protein
VLRLVHNHNSQEEVLSSSTSAMIRRRRSHTSCYSLEITCSPAASTDSSDSTTQFRVSRRPRSSFIKETSKSSTSSSSSSTRRLKLMARRSTDSSRRRKLLFLDEERDDDDETTLLASHARRSDASMSSSPNAMTDSNTHNIPDTDYAHHPSAQEYADEPEDLMTVLLRFSQWYDDSSFVCDGDSSWAAADIAWPSKIASGDDELDEDTDKALMNEETTVCERRSSDTNRADVSALAAAITVEKKIDEDVSQPTALPPVHRSLLSSMSSRQTKQQSSRNISWADPMEHVRTVDCSHNLKPDNLWKRQVSCRLTILLLSSTQKKYEFIACQVLWDDRLTVRKVLDKLPVLATSPALAQETYAGLCRPSPAKNRGVGKEVSAAADPSSITTTTELINATCLQDYDLQQRELLWAVPQHSTGRELAPLVDSLLSSRRLQRLVSFGKRSGNSAPAHWLVSESAASLATDATTSLPNIAMIPSPQPCNNKELVKALSQPQPSLQTLLASAVRSRIVTADLSSTDESTTFVHDLKQLTSMSPSLMQSTGTNTVGPPASIA